MTGPFDGAIQGLERMIANTVLLKEMAEWMANFAPTSASTEAGERKTLEAFVERFRTNNPEWRQP